MQRLRRTLSLGGETESKETEGYTQQYSSTPNTPLHKAKSFSNNNFHDVELMESGGAREVISSKGLAPLNPQSRDLQRYHVLREDKRKFWLYCEKSNDFVLSAYMANNCFYISQYENFPSTFNKKQPSGYIAIVRLDPKTKIFKLFSRFCEGCDDVLGYHTCGKGELSNGDRQMLMELSHLTNPINCGYESIIDCNVVRVKLPMVYDDLSRDCWCARFGRRREQETQREFPAIPGYGRSKPCAEDPHHSEPTTKGMGGRRSSVAMNVGAQERCEVSPSELKKSLKHKAHSSPQLFAAQSNHNQTPAFNNPSVLAGDKTKGDCVLVTKKPRFDRSTGSLRMKFVNNRVRMASSKNLIFCLDKNSDVAAQVNDNKPMPSDSRIVCQFGKADEDRFNMDFAFPLSPVQAFGMCLTLFKWQAGEK